MLDSSLHLWQQAVNTIYLNMPSFPPLLPLTSPSWPPVHHRRCAAMDVSKVLDELDVSAWGHNFTVFRAAAQASLTSFFWVWASIVSARLPIIPDDWENILSTLSHGGSFFSGICLGGWTSWMSPSHNMPDLMTSGMETPRVMPLSPQCNSHSSTRLQTCCFKEQVGSLQEADFRFQLFH